MEMIQKETTTPSVLVKASETQTNGHQRCIRATAAGSDNQGTKARTPAGTRRAPGRLSLGATTRALSLEPQRAPGIGSRGDECKTRQSKTYISKDYMPTRAPAGTEARAPGGHSGDGGSERQPEHQRSGTSGHQASTRATEARSHNQGTKARAPTAGTRRAPGRRSLGAATRAPRLGHQRRPPARRSLAAATKATRLGHQRAPDGHQGDGVLSRQPKH